MTSQNPDRPAEPDLEQIGQGKGGTVLGNCKRAFKIATRPEENEWIKHEEMMQKRVLWAAKTYELIDLVSIPESFGTIHAGDPWIEKNKGLSDAKYQGCDMMESERVMPVPELMRHALASHFWPADDREWAVNLPLNSHCLLRPYLGLETFPPQDGGQVLMQNYPLSLSALSRLKRAHVANSVASLMGETLAVLHWAAGIDAAHIKFMLAAPRESYDTARSVTHLGRYSLWLMDFDHCCFLPKGNAAVQAALEGFSGNPWFYPTPQRQNLWQNFKDRYIAKSTEILTKKKRAPDRARGFIEGVVAGHGLLQPPPNHWYYSPHRYMRAMMARQRALDLKPDEDEEGSEPEG